ncbi:MAG: ABC transporter permease [Anaerolineae bacterium]|nr:ABC transporter permease [Anaerolineae bacterium]
MNVTESFLTAIDSLMANKMRSILTMLGVIIGVAAVIALMAIGNGFSAFVSNEIQSLGTNLVIIVSDTDVSGGYQTLSMSDIDALSDPANTPDVTEVAATVQSTKEIIYQRRNTSATVVGVTSNYFDVYNLSEVSQGNLPTQQDNDTRARVAVLGATIATKLFEDTYPIGEAIKISGTDYRVIGILAEKGGSMSSPDDQIFVPLETAQAYITPLRTRKGEMAVTMLLTTAASEDATDAAIQQITDTLRTRHNVLYAGEDDFQIISQTSLLDTFSTITSALTLFLGAIAGISLLVGGIGIMNIMLVSVTERTREIGIRKAVGALQRDILIQFLIEALVLSLVGGLLGIGLGWLMTVIVAPIMEDAVPVIDLGTIALATSFAAGVGLVFGIYPAWRAARLHPIEALRYE